jgi:hypothetical protein
MVRGRGFCGKHVKEENFFEIDDIYFISQYRYIEDPSYTGNPIRSIFGVPELGKRVFCQGCETLSKPRLFEYEILKKEQKINTGFNFEIRLELQKDNTIKLNTFHNLKRLKGRYSKKICDSVYSLHKFISELHQNLYDK